MLSECADMRGGSCWSGAKGRLRSWCVCEGPPAGDSTRVTERLLSLDRASSHSLFTSSMVCLVLHAPVVFYFSRCLCQTVPVFSISTHTAIAPQLSPALSPFSLFFFLLFLHLLCGDMSRATRAIQDDSARWVYRITKPPILFPHFFPAGF